MTLSMAILVMQTYAMQVPTAKLGLTATDQITSLLAELELTPISPDGKKTSSANAALWQQGHRLTLLYFDATAAREAAALCKEMASGELTTE